MCIRDRHIPFDCEIEVDGRWYVYLGLVDVTSVDTRLEPGKQYNDWVRVTPDNLWQEKTPQGGKPAHLPLPPGKHTIRIAYPLSGGKPHLRPISGPVEIEVGKQPDGKNAADGAQSQPQPSKGEAAPPVTAGADDKQVATRRALQLRKKLDEKIDYELVVQATLDKVLDSLLLREGIPWRVNEAAFRAAQQDKDIVNYAEIERISKLEGVTRAAVLRRLLDNVQPKSGKIDVAFVVRRDGVEITTEQAYRNEFYPDWKEAWLPPLVYEAFSDVPLREALTSLAADCDVNIVIDARVAEKAKVKVTAEFATAPLDSAVELLADMADLKVVRLGNVYYVTSPEHAGQLKKEQQERAAEEEKGKADPAKPPMNP